MLWVFSVLLVRACAGVWVCVRGHVWVHSTLVFCAQERGFSEGFGLHIACSIVSSLCACTASAPADVVSERRDGGARGVGGVPTHVSGEDSAAK